MMIQRPTNQNIHIHCITFLFDFIIKTITRVYHHHTSVHCVIKCTIQFNQHMQHVQLLCHLSLSDDSIYFLS